MVSEITSMGTMRGAASSDVGDFDVLMAAAAIKEVGGDDGDERRYGNLVVA
jgi:hypothetical protein